jgi:hypothetical protein
MRLRIASAWFEEGIGGTAMALLAADICLHTGYLVSQLADIIA